MQQSHSGNALDTLASSLLETIKDQASTIHPPSGNMFLGNDISTMSRRSSSCGLAEDCQLAIHDPLALLENTDPDVFQCQICPT